MPTVRPKNNSDMSHVWQKCHVAAYASIAVLSLVCSITFYRVLAASQYHCYQYNSVLVVNELSRDAYTAHVVDQSPWYQSSYCHDAFSFALRLSVGSFVWMGMCMVFGCGGGADPDDFQSDLSSVAGQWHIVFWATLFNFLCMIRSLVIALQFTDGYVKFRDTLTGLPESDDFRMRYFNDVHRFYVTSVVLFWLLNVLCVLNFSFMFYRCAMGVDFVVDEDSELSRVPQPVVMANAGTQT